MNTPWYRPTRVCLATSGSEFGWRNGTGKWPPYYPDSLPAIFNVGPGSPTGISFGYGAKFPAKYQEALFMCDWSYGKLYAVHLTPEGSAYKGELEEFRQRLAVAADRRGRQSRRTGRCTSPSAAAGRSRGSTASPMSATNRRPRSKAGEDSGARGPRPCVTSWKRYHGKTDPKAVEAAWPYLGHEDRFIRFAARVAIEHQDPKTWQERALAEKDPGRPSAPCWPWSRDRPAIRSTTAQAGDPVPDRDAQGRRSSTRWPGIDWDKLTDAQRLDLLRIYAVLFNRTGTPEEAARARLVIAGSIRTSRQRAAS